MNSLAASAAPKLSRQTIALVLVASLGYFVDVYDLILFAVVRQKSLVGIGVPEAQLLETGKSLLALQMNGMLVGGILWGVLGDKRGRLSVLFGSIFLYSLANAINAAVHDVQTYAAMRFLAGVGLAGELGAGITLVTETLSKHRRGIGTTIIASVGVLGAVAAGLVGDRFEWRTAYVVGAVLGFVLLALRIGLHESGLFVAAKSSDAARGSVWLLLGNGPRLRRFVALILVGVPVWFIVGILITFSPEIGKALGMQELPKAGLAVTFNYIGVTFGDMASGFLSQALQSRQLRGVPHP